MHFDVLSKSTSTYPPTHSLTNLPPFPFLGTGLSALSSSRAGADLIHIYNSGHYRMHGLGSLAGLMPYSNANDLLLTLSSTILPALSNSLDSKPTSSSSSSTSTTQTPAHAALIAGICASDPTRSIPSLLSELKSLGFTGVQNFPTVGLIDAGSRFRAGLEETGMGFECEVQMVRQARGLGMLCVPYVFCEDEARRMVDAGAEVVVVHCGLTLGKKEGSGSGGKTGMGLGECVQLCRGVVEAVGGLVKERTDRAKDIRHGDDVAEDNSPEVIILCHGGPIATPEDADFVLSQVGGLHGFLGASSVERSPVEEAIEARVKEFKALKTS